MAHPKLSKRAEITLRRLYAGIWYSPQAPLTKAMAELIDAGLVGTIGRPKIIERVFAPKGTKPFKDIRLPEKPKWLK